MEIPKEIAEVIDREPLYIISTASKEGIPNTIYVKFLKVYDEGHILIADNKFSKTEKNLQENPKVSFVVLDKENKKAYQVKGTAEIFKEGKIFDETVEWVETERSTPDTFPKSAVLLKVDEIYSGAERIL